VKSFDPAQPIPDPLLEAAACNGQRAQKDRWQ